MTSQVRSGQSLNCWPLLEHDIFAQNNDNKRISSQWIGMNHVPDTSNDNSKTLLAMGQAKAIWGH